MAKVVGPLFSQAASGKHGSIVYARNRSGMYTRPAPGAAPSPSGEQMAWQDAMAAVYNTWETDPGITEGRRTQWLDFARSWPIRDRFGREMYLDALRWFVKFGIHRQRAGLGLHLGPPIDPSCNYYPTLTFTQEPWGIVVDADARPSGDQMICLSKVAAQSTNRNFCPSKRTYVDHLMAANEWPYLIWLNGDLDVAEKRYFFVYRIIDGAGRPSSQQIDYVDAALDTAGWTRVADEDTYCLSTVPTGNRGGLTSMTVYELGSSQMFALLRWDLTGIPGSAVVSSAAVWIWCDSITFAGDVAAHEGLTEWAEYEATWNQRLTGVNWGVPGGEAGVDFTAVAEDTETVAVAPAWYEWDVSGPCPGWVADDGVNFGVWMKHATAFITVYFKSHEWGTPAERPYIKIVFGS